MRLITNEELEMISGGGNEPKRTEKSSSEKLVDSISNLIDKSASAIKDLGASIKDFGSAIANFGGGLKITDSIQVSICTGKGTANTTNTSCGGGTSSAGGSTNPDLQKTNQD